MKLNPTSLPEGHSPSDEPRTRSGNYLFLAQIPVIFKQTRVIHDTLTSQHALDRSLPHARPGGTRGAISTVETQSLADLQLRTAWV